MKQNLPDNVLEFSLSYKSNKNYKKSQEVSNAKYNMWAGLLGDDVIVIDMPFGEMSIRAERASKATANRWKSHQEKTRE